jgi:hypothetical protein
LLAIAPGAEPVSINPAAFDLQDRAYPEHRQGKEQLVIISQNYKGARDKIGHQPKHDYPDRKVLCVEAQYSSKHHTPV